MVGQRGEGGTRKYEKKKQKKIGERESGAHQVYKKKGGIKTKKKKRKRKGSQLCCEETMRVPKRGERKNWTEKHR